MWFAGRSPSRNLHPECVEKRRDQVPEELDLSGEVEWMIRTFLKKQPIPFLHIQSEIFARQK